MRLTTSLIAALLAARSVAGHAEPVAVDVSGDCPTRAQLDHALAVESVAIDRSARWTLEVSSTAGRASLTLRHPARERTTRTIESADCAAVAEAFALIVATALEAQPAPPAPPSPPAVSPPGSTSRLERQAPAPGRRDAVLSIAIAGGLEIAANHDTPSFWELDGTYRRGPWRLRLVASAAGWAGSADIERRQRLARAEIGTGLRGRGTWLRPLAGAGVAMTTVRAEPSTGIELTRLHPVVSASLVGGIEITDLVSLRGEAGVLGFPIADRYLTDMGVAGRSPRLQLRLGAGIEFRTRM